MSALTNYGENQLIDYFRGAGITLPTEWYIGLLEDFTSDATFTEFTGSDYGRQAVERSLLEWAGTQGAGSTLASSGTSHATSNNSEVDFGTGLDGTATHWGLFDAEVGGNLWAAVPLQASLVIDVTDPVSFAAGTLAVSLGLSGGLSNYASNKLIDLLFRAQAYAWPSSTYAAYTTTMPTNAVPGTEPAGGYARVEIETSFSEWSGTDDPASTAPSTGDSGLMCNINAIIFPVPTSNQGAVQGTMLMDAPTGGNMLVWGALLANGVPSAFTINASGDAARFEAGQYRISVR